MDGCGLDGASIVLCMHTCIHKHQGPLIRRSKTARPTDRRVLWCVFLNCSLTVVLLLGAAVGGPPKKHPGLSPQLILSRAARAKGFPFSADSAAFAHDLLPAFAAQWASANVLLGRSAAAGGRRFIESFKCSSWAASKHKLELQLTLGLDMAAVLRYCVMRHDASTLELTVCTRSKATGSWNPLIHFEGTPKEGSGYKKICTHRENLVHLCNSHVPSISAIELAEMLASVPVIPAVFSQTIRAIVVEDSAAEAAVAESSGSVSQFDSEYSTSARADSTKVPDEETISVWAPTSFLPSPNSEEEEED